jgi:hypothetical protein
MAVYFMMADYIGYMSHLPQYSYPSESLVESSFWATYPEELTIITAPVVIPEP